MKNIRSRIKKLIVFAMVFMLCSGTYIGPVDGGIPEPETTPYLTSGVKTAFAAEADEADGDEEAEENQEPEEGQEKDEDKDEE